jgi:Predicted membrane protein
MKKTRILVFLGILIAMYVVLTALFEIPLSPSARIRFGFLPLSYAAGLFGPLFGGLVGGAGDILGWLYAPKGAYFPGLTLSAILSGAIYGLFLYRQKKSILRITLAVVIITIFIDLGLNTYWMTFIYGKGFFAVLPTRIVKSLIMLPIQISMIYALWRYAGEYIENVFIKNRA